MALWRALDIYQARRFAARQAPATNERTTDRPQRRATKGVAAKPLGDRLCEFARRRSCDC